MVAAWRTAGSRPTRWELMLCSRYSPGMPIAPASRTAGTSIPRRWQPTNRAVISYSISPGFWLKGQAVRLARDLTRWAQNVRDMVASGAKWQLVTTFSEWGEGTIVEPATEWASASGFGQYLDVLHANGK